MDLYVLLLLTFLTLILTDTKIRVIIARKLNSDLFKKNVLTYNFYIYNLIYFGSQENYNQPNLNYSPVVNEFQIIDCQSFINILNDS